MVSQKELELVINRVIAYYGNPNNSFSSAGQCKKIIKLVILGGMSVFPWEHPIPTNMIHPFSAQKHSPTRVFSFNVYNNTYHNTLPCLNGTIMNYYLNEGIDTIKTPRAIISYQPHYSYYSVLIIAGRKTIIPPIILLP